MCGRASYTASPHDLAALLDVDLERIEAASPRVNIAPTDPMVVVRVAKDGAREARTMRWGLVPHWARDLREGAKHFNARVETVATKALFRDAFERRRCVVVVDAFYEWRAPEAPPAHHRAKRPRKIPHVIRATSGGLLTMAGLWERWMSPAGERVETCTVITTGARGPVATVHDRMPIVLPPSEVEAWLEPSARPDALLEILTRARADFLVEALESMPSDLPPKAAVAMPQLSLFGDKQ